MKMESYTLLFILIGTLLVATVSKRIRETLISLPLVYTLFGLAVAILFTDVIGLQYDNPVIKAIAELTLVLVLASDSSRIQLKGLLRYHDLSLRMLILALPLTFAVGTLIGAIIFEGSNIWVLAILAVALAPIDSSLAESSVDNPKVPIRIRQALNVEGGLDDGITLPFIFLFISLAISSETDLGTGSYLIFTVQKIAFGSLAGLILGYLGARYISWGSKSGWMSSQFQKIAWLALVLLTYGAAEAIGGNGFIAAFFFGIISGNTIEKQESNRLYRFAEVENTLLIMLTFMFYGAVMLYPALQHINIEMIIYAILSLTLIRMLPVAISLIGTRLRLESILYLGWFGPRGIASILYVYTILQAEGIGRQEMIFSLVMLTIFFSVIAHGMSAVPLTNWYAKRIAQLDKSGLAQAETQFVPAMPTRKPAVNINPLPSTAADSSKIS
jgi:NhaP-type Na+/H+ or K+/H+ antiporter